MSSYTETSNYFRTNHRCIRCGKQDAYTLGHRSLCYECAEYNRERVKIWAHKHKDERKAKYERLKASGICVNCKKTRQ